jgi:hypothetical protein
MVIIAARETVMEAIPTFRGGRLRANPDRVVMLIRTEWRIALAHMRPMVGNAARWRAAIMLGGIARSGQKALNTEPNMQR